MEQFLLLAVSAFVLFAVILPLLGVLVGFVCYYVFPYIFGAVVCLLAAIFLGSQTLLTWWMWVIGAVWAGAVFGVRAMFRAIGEELEHYKAAHATLLGGFPYFRLRKRKALLLECEGYETLLS